MINDNRSTVPCRWCGKPTPMTGTKECDPCHELRVRINMDPEITSRILAARAVPFERKKVKGNDYDDVLALRELTDVASMLGALLDNLPEMVEGYYGKHAQVFFERAEEMLGRRQTGETALRMTYPRWLKWISA